MSSDLSNLLPQLQTLRAAGFLVSRFKDGNFEVDLVHIAPAPTPDKPMTAAQALAVNPDFTNAADLVLNPPDLALPADDRDE